MANPYFRFKQFTVFHDKCAMKVGIDGVLLGAWAPINNSKRILDIGTGSGLIALMLAQRTDGFIDAIDSDENAIVQARENVDNSPWVNRMNLFHSPLQEFSNQAVKQYDLIVSNPPFFHNSTKAPDQRRTMARHTDSLSHEDLIDNASLLLNRTGRICLILPVLEGLKCVKYAEKRNLYCTKIVTVFPTPTAEAKRLLIELSSLHSPRIELNLIIESNQRHQYSEDFSLLAQDFYLKL